MKDCAARYSFFCGFHFFKQSISNLIKYIRYETKEMEKNTDTANVYILYCVTHKTPQVQRTLKRHGIVSYIPRMEKYLRSIDKVVDDVIMFPGYLFVESYMNQTEFSIFLKNLSDEKNGVIKELKENGVSALTEEEKDFYRILFDQNYLLMMSYGYREGNKTLIYSGPLLKLQDSITKVDRKNGIAYLKQQFMHRNIQAGLIETKEIHF